MKKNIQIQKYREIISFLKLKMDGFYMKSKRYKFHPNTYTGLDMFLDSGIKKEVIKTSNFKERLQAYYCTKHHNIFFWRDTKRNEGHCSLCGKFNKSIHIPVNDGYKNLEVDNMAWEEQTVSVIDWEERKGKEVIGTLIEKRENVGENNSMMYILEDDKKQRMAIWGTGFLDPIMETIDIGQKIKVVFTGTGKATKKGFKPPKLFKVFVDR